MFVSGPVQGSFRYRRHTEAEVGVAVPASAAPPPIGDLTSRDSLHAMVVDSVGR